MRKGKRSGTGTNTAAGCRGIRHHASQNGKGAGAPDEEGRGQPYPAHARTASEFDCIAGAHGSQCRCRSMNQPPARLGSCRISDGGSVRVLALDWSHRSAWATTGDLVIDDKRRASRFGTAIVEPGRHGMAAALCSSAGERTDDASPAKQPGTRAGVTSARLTSSKSR
jgi:hypothetical protein